MTPLPPTPAGQPAPRTHTADGGERSAAGSTYGDYTPPGKAHSHAEAPVGDAFQGGSHGVNTELSAEIAPDDPDYELWRARRAQEATRARHIQAAQGPTDSTSAAGEEDPGSADDTVPR
jgi:hypothetical protein